MRDYGYEIKFEVSDPRELNLKLVITCNEINNLQISSMYAQLF